MQTPGDPRALASCPPISHREEKSVSSSTSRRWPSRVAGQHSHLLAPRQPALGRRDSSASRGGRNGRCDSEPPSTRARNVLCELQCPRVAGAAGCGPPRVRACGRRRLRRFRRCGGAGNGGGRRGPEPNGTGEKKARLCRSCRRASLPEAATALCWRGGGLRCVACLLLISELPPNKNQGSCSEIERLSFTFSPYTRCAVCILSRAATKGTVIAGGALACCVLEGHGPWNPLALQATAVKLEQRQRRISRRRNSALRIIKSNP